MVVRPGRIPGASPISNAPRTLPRLSAGRNVAWGSRSQITDATSKDGVADSAIDARPTTATTDPSRSCLPSGSSPSKRASRVLAASPDRQRMERCAYAPAPVAVGPISMTLVLPLVATRSRRCRIASSSLRSGPTIRTVSASHASLIVAGGRPNTTSAGMPSPNWASTLSVPTTVRANFAQTYASSLVSCDPPIIPTRSGPASCMAWAAWANAEPQSVPSNWCWSCLSRISGVVRRSSLLTAS